MKMNKISNQKKNKDKFTNQKKPEILEKKLWYQIRIKKKVIKIQFKIKILIDRLILKI